MAQMTYEPRAYGRQRRALLKIRGKLTLRQFTREPGRLLGAIIGAIFILPVVAGLAVASFFGYRNLPAPWPAQLLAGVLVLIWLIWMFFPIIAFSLNEGLDVRRLLVYPLRARDIAISVILGTIFDYPTYLMVPLFIAIGVGWGSSVVEILVVSLALLIAYGQVILSSQLVLTVFGGVLESRRFRDVAIIIFSLVGSSCYLIQIGLQRMAENASRFFTPEQLLSWRPINTLQWLPPGAAARAIEQASLGQWGASLLWLAMAAGWLAVIAWTWWRLLDRIITGQGFLIRSRPPKPKVESTTRASTAAGRRWRWPAWLPPDVAALADKELRALWRVPQRRVGLIQGALLPLFFVIPALASGQLPAAPDWLGLALPLYIAFAFWISTSNMLGMEGTGLATLLVTPVRRANIFRAKALALALVALPLLLVMTAAFAILVRNWTAPAGLLMALGVMGVVAAVSSVTSVRFPFPVRLEKATGNSSLSFGGGCLTALVNLLTPLLVAVFTAPIVLPPIAGYVFDIDWLVVVSVPLGLLYGIVLFWFGTGWAGSWLLEREPEVLEATQLEKSG